jgi:hypothetical protein
MVGLVVWYTKGSFPHPRNALGESSRGLGPKGTILRHMDHEWGPAP